MSDENLIGKVTSQQRNAQLQPPHDDTTELAYDTTWGTIRIYNLTAREDDATHLVDFKAFVKSFRDTFSPGWTESHYPNQSVPIAHQARPRRIIQLSFSVPASSADEAIRNMQKVSFLAQTMFPTIEFDGSSDAYRVKSNFVAIKFANLVQNQRDGGPLPGWISGFNFIPNLEEGSFVLNGKETGKKSVAKEAFKQTDQSYIIPKLIDIDMEFKPIEVRDRFGYRGPKEGWGNTSDQGWPWGIKFANPTAIGDNLKGTSAESIAPNSKLDKLMKSKMNRIGKKW